MSGRKEECPPRMAKARRFHVSVVSILILLASALAARPLQAASIFMSPSSLSITKACSAYNQQFTATGGSGSYTYSINSGALPPGVSLSATGLLSGTPTEAKGSYYFSILVQDSLGSINIMSYALTVEAPTITVAPGELPKAPFGKPYSVQLTASGGCGGYTFREVGGLSVDGLTFSSSGLLSGTVTKGLYSGAFTVEVTDSAGFTGRAAYYFDMIAPQPVAADRTATTRMNTPVNIPIVGETSFDDGHFWYGNLDFEVVRQPAHGSVVKILPMATYTPAEGFYGTDSFTYVVKGVGGTSEPATVTITVTGRSDPSKDAEVLGILQAQADSARRLATGQIDNFQRRLETLHTGAASGGFSNGISISSASARQNRDPLAGMRGSDDDWGRRFLDQPDVPTPGQHAEYAGSWSVWTGGAVHFGKTLPGSSADGIDFTTSGVSIGADRAFGERFALGAGIGYGHDSSDVGQHDSRSTVDAYSAAVYGSYRPLPLVYVDALVGYQKMSFDARRYVTDTGGTVTGSRDGKQYFASLSVGYEHRTHDGMLISPYGRFDFARATLDSYSEHGDDLYNLAYRSQTVKTSTGVLGLRASWLAQRDYGVWMPQLRVEYRHDFQGSSEASMQYLTWLDGPLYRASLGDRQARNHTLVGAGVMLQTLKGWSMRMEYQNLLDNNTRDNQSVQLGVEKKF